MIEHVINVEKVELNCFFTTKYHWCSMCDSPEMQAKE